MFWLGLDPGGEGKFGWGVLRGTSLPLRILKTGVADSAKSALDDSFGIIRNEKFAAAGIDAPLFWRAGGDRFVDRHLRKATMDKGVKSGTVAHVNSLRGACVIQGIVSAMLLRQSDPELKISESHPKALIWLMKKRDPSRISLTDLSDYFVADSNFLSDDERDAALGGLCAWASVFKPDGWKTLYEEEGKNLKGDGEKEAPIICPLTPKPSYWMPCP